MSDFELLITDDGLPEGVERALTKAEISVLLAK